MITNFSFKHLSYFLNTLVDFVPRIGSVTLDTITKVIIIKYIIIKHIITKHITYKIFIKLQMI